MPNPTKKIYDAQLINPSGVVISVNSVQGAVTLQAASSRVSISSDPVAGIISIDATGGVGSLNGLQGALSIAAGEGTAVSAAGTNVTVGLAPATATTLGGVKVGTGLAINNGVLSVGGSGSVTSVNTLSGDITLAAGAGVIITPNTGTNTLTLSADSSVLGTVKSVALSMPGIFNVTGSPVTTTGTLTAALASQNSKTFLAGPASGPADIPAFRAITAGDLPAASNVGLGVVQVQTNGGIAISGGSVISIDPTHTIVSFNGRVGAVTLTSGDVTAAGGAVLASPAFTGTPTAPTPTQGDNSTTLATTAFVQTTVNAAVSAGAVTSFNTRKGDVTLTLADVTSAGGAPLASPVFTGNPRVPTATPGDATTTIASTAFVAAAIAATGGVTSVNSRTGNVTILNTDISGAGGALLAGATFTGTLKAPNPSPSDNSNTVATTSYVQNALQSLGVTSVNGRTGAVTINASDVSGAGGALLASPIFTGSPQAPTPTAGNNSTQIATTAFVANAVLSATTPIATTTTLGGVIVPTNSGITIDASGNIAAKVTSVAGRIGDVVLSVSDVTGAAPINAPAFTGAATAPTVTAGDSSTRIATTAFVANAVAARATSMPVAAGDNPMGDAASFRSVILTGTLTGNARVLIPTGGGRWTFANETTGSFSVTIALSNGGSTVGQSFVLPQGDTVDIFADPSLGAVPATTVGITQPLNDNTTKLATTAFVMAQLGGQVAVQSWNGRTGAVTLQSSDVSAVGAAMLSASSNTFTGSATFGGSVGVTGALTGPTATVGDSSTNVATTAYVMNSNFNTTSVNLSNVDVTLTSLQYGAKSIRFTGTLTASVNVIFPLSGQWSVYNDTTGSFTLTVTNTKGATYVVPHAQSAQIISLNDLGIINANVAGNVITPATSSVIGGVIVPGGTGLTVDGSGNLSGVAATASTLGMIKIGTGLNISSGVVSTAIQTVAGQSPSAGNVALAVGNITGAAPLASPAFTGTPTAPTPTGGDNSTKIATTAFVQSTISSLGVTSFNTRTGAITLTGTDITNAGGALLASPAFTGTPTAPTATQGTNTTQIATTQFVQTAISSVAAGVTSFNSRTGAVTLASADITGAGGALLASPTFTGTPAAPTATAGTNTTQIATTAFVAAAISGVSGVASFNSRTGAVTLTSTDITNAGGATLASPIFTGNPTAPNPTVGDNTASLATTQFVHSSVFGETSVPLTNANVTLTATQAGQQIIKLTGTLTANVTVTLPAGSAWKVYNATSGSFTVTLASATGSATTVINQNSVMNVLTDSAVGVIVLANSSQVAIARIGVNIDTGSSSTAITQETFFMFVDTVTFSANFAGSQATAAYITSATSPYTVTIMRYAAAGGSTSVGQISFDASGNPTFTSTGGNPVTYSPGDRLSYQFPTSNIMRFTSTLKGAYQ